MTAPDPQRPELRDLINRRLLRHSVRDVGVPSVEPTRGRVLRILRRTVVTRLDGDEVVGHLRTATAVGAFGRTSAPRPVDWHVDAAQVARWITETDVLVEGERLDAADYVWLAERLDAAARRAVADAPSGRDRTDLVVDALVRRILSGHVLRIDPVRGLLGHRQARERWQFSVGAVQRRNTPADVLVDVAYLRERGRLGLLQLGEGPLDDEAWTRVLDGLISAVAGAGSTPQTT